MQKYQNYKTTNIKWTDQIPVDWSEIPLRKVFEDVKNTNTNGDHIRMLSLVKDIGIIPYEERGNQGNKSSEKLEKYKIVEKGDFVINKMNAVLGSLGISEYEGLVSPVYYVLRNRNEDEFVSRYFELIFKTRSVQRFLRTMSKGIMEIRESVDWAELKNMALPLPSIEDQRSIVEYVNRVDKLTRDFIKQKQKYIELLKEYKQSKINELVTKGLDPNVKMKDSGIEWLGQIPEHWEVRRIKDLFSINTESLSETTDPEYKLLYLDIGNNGQGKIKHLQSLLFKNAPSRARRVVHSGSIILSTVRTYLRSISFFESPPQNLIASTGYAVLDIRNNDYRGGYFYSLLQSSYFIDKVVAESVGVSYPAINTTKLSSIKIAFTSKLEEQLLITKEVAHINQQIGMLISKAQNQIKIIRKYRQSLIYELVTGIRKP